MRLIDADALGTTNRPIGKIMMFGGEYVYTQTEIDSAPTVDAVPVVRCKDCKWWVREGNDSYGYAMFCDHDCSLGGQGIKKPTDYCSYGERKGGDE